MKDFRHNNGKGKENKPLNLGKYAILHNLIFIFWQLNPKGKRFKLKESP